MKIVNSTHKIYNVGGEKNVVCVFWSPRLSPRKKKVKEGKKKMSSTSSSGSPADSSPNDAVVPTPVRMVMMYEADEAMAKALQQRYTDEQMAFDLEEQLNIGDEFEAATRMQDDARLARLLNRTHE